MNLEINKFFEDFALITVKKKQARIRMLSNLFVSIPSWGGVLVLVGV